MKYLLVPVIVLSTLALAVYGVILLNNKRPSGEKNISTQQVRISSPAAKVITHYTIPKIKASDTYTIILTGDSMTDYLGDNTDLLREKLAEYYPDKTFGVFNYGFGSTNILSLHERLENDTSYSGENYPAILTREFDVIIIESMGHNPLSDYPLQEGLKKQKEELDKIVYKLVNEKPKSLIVFLATIAPSEKYYAKGVVELTDEQRSAWVSERKAYIENHIIYAKEHYIPLIDVYHDSLVDGDVDISLVNPDDHIHPSQNGVTLISREIADFLFENKILIK